MEGQNDLMGVHAGATVDFAKLYNMSGPLHPVVRAGIGGYSNDIDGGVTILWNHVLDRIPVGTTTSTNAFSFDLDATLSYELKENLSLYAGFRVLYLNNVALAPNQVASTTSYNGQPFYSISEDHVRFQGLKAGVSMHF